MADAILAERANIEGRHGKSYKEHLMDYYGHDKSPEQMAHYLNNSSKFSGVPLDTIIDNPSFTSQTKETLKNKPSEFGSSYEPSEKLIKKLSHAQKQKLIEHWG